MPSFISKNTLQIIFLLITLLAGVIILSPRLNFHPYLAQGDHGRDLYSFKKTSEGAVPYKDYWSQNGPLMPYYYSVFYHSFGTSLQSTLKGFNFLVLLVGVFIYLCCSTVMTPLGSFSCAMWYWAFRGNEFFYTFNHIGAVFFMITTLYCSLQYTKKSSRRHIILGYLSSFGAALIRPNIGVACLISLFLNICLTNFVYKRPQQLKKFLTNSFLSAALLTIIFLIYKALSSQTPFTQMTDAHSNELAYWQYAKWQVIPKAFLSLINSYMALAKASWPNIALTVIFLISFIRASYLLVNKKFNPENKKHLLLVLAALSMFYTFNIAEFMVSNLWFRQHWVITLQVMLFFFILELGLQKVHRGIIPLLMIVLLSISSLTIYNTNMFIHFNKIPPNRLHIGSNSIYLPWNHQQWIQTITRTTQFIQQHTSKGDKIVAIPYTPIYYFLSDRDSATWDLTFFNRPWREEPSIAQIENNNVEYVILSNRAFRSVEKRFGVLGKTYGFKLKAYLDQNFTEVASYGPWDLPAGWFENHAVKILKKMGNEGFEPSTP